MYAQVINNQKTLDLKRYNKYTRTLPVYEFLFGLTGFPETRFILDVIKNLVDVAIFQIDPCQNSQEEMAGW